MVKQLAIAITIAAALLTGCGGSAGLSDQNHRDFVAGCSSSQPKAACECFYTQLTTKQGVSTDAKLKLLNDQIQAASSAGSVPAQMRNAILACKSLVRR